MKDNKKCCNIRILNYCKIMDKHISNVQCRIIAAKGVTYAATKRKPKKFRLVGIQTLTSVIPVQHSNKLY